MENKLKSKVIQSKSSNSALITKPGEKRNKKCKSNAQFQQNIIKKRGVFVTNERTKEPLNIRGIKIYPNQVKSPPRPPPGKKRFLDSVFMILSKSTAGTQFPDEQESKTKKIKKKQIKNNINKEKRFKSKVLNNNQIVEDHFEVIQHKKDIVHTPSVYSDTTSNNDSKCKTDLTRITNAQEECINQGKIVKEITEGRKLQEKKVKIVDNDPFTVISETKAEKKLYNFFVDLLETTFNACSSKETPISKNKTIESAVSSKVVLEINESVAKKLNVENKPDPPDIFKDVTQKSSKSCCYTNHQEWQDNTLLNHFYAGPSSKPSRQEIPLKTPTKFKIRSESYALYKKNKISPPKSKSTEVKKFSNRKNQKNNLLNMLKDRLKMEDYSYEEPQNLYQALKVMAKNKKKSEKSIRFDIPVRQPNDGGRDPGCMLKRRKIISPSTRFSSNYSASTKTMKTNSKFDEYSEDKYYKYNRITDNDNISNHSLEVYGFDYNMHAIPTQERKLWTPTEENLLLSYHYSPSYSEVDLTE